jgi:hypothetical protein
MYLINFGLFSISNYPFLKKLKNLEYFNYNHFK